MPNFDLTFMSFENRKKKQLIITNIGDVMVSMLQLRYNKPDIIITTMLLAKYIATDILASYNY